MGGAMNQEDIIRMARESDMDIDNDGSEWGSIITAEPADLERFAALVAAAEREACAKVCEETTASWTQHLYNEGCIDCAKTIRARGQA